MIHKYGSSLAGWFDSRSLMRITAAVIWRLDYGWRICFQVDSLTCLASQCWLLAEGHHPGYMDLSMGLLDYPHNMADGFFQSEWSKREQDRSSKVFYDPALEVTWLFLQYPIHFTSLHRSALFSVWGNTQGCEYQEAEITAGHLGDWLPHCLKLTSHQ